MPKKFSNKVIKVMFPEKLLRLVEYFTILDDMIISSYSETENYCMNQLCNYRIRKNVDKV